MLGNGPQPGGGEREKPPPEAAPEGHAACSWCPRGHVVHLKEPPTPVVTQVQDRAAFTDPRADREKRLSGPTGRCVALLIKNKRLSYFNLVQF